MNTQAQTLLYFSGVHVYLLDRTAYKAYLKDMNDDRSHVEKRQHFQEMIRIMYNEIASIDIKAYLELHKDNPKLLRDIKIDRTHLRFITDIFEGTHQHWSRLKDASVEELDTAMAKYGFLYACTSYLHYVANKTDRVFWFIQPYHLLSYEFLEYVGEFSPRWANIFALEGVKLQPVQIGYKEPEKVKKEINDIFDYDIDSDTSGSMEFILPDSALKKLQEILTTNPPTDIRLEEERTLMLDMIASCLSGECYLVMYRL